MEINFELNIDKSIQEKMQLLCEQMTKNIDGFKPTFIGSYGGLFDKFIIAAQYYTPSDVVILQQKGFEKLRAEVEKCNNEFPQFSEKSLSELFGVQLLSIGFTVEKAKTPTEIIKSKKNKKPFYKKLDRLKNGSSK